MYKLTTLKNGVRVVTQYISHVNHTSAGLYIGSGSFDETRKNNGVAHFLEHLVIEQGHLSGAGQKLLELGYPGTAYTTYDHTAYQFLVPGRYLTLAVRALATMVKDENYSNALLTQERATVLAEYDNHCADLASVQEEVIKRALFPKGRLGLNPIGTEKNIRTMPLSFMQAFKRRHYVSENMVLVAVGRVKHEHMVKLAEKHFGDLPQQAKPEAHSPSSLVTGKSHTVDFPSRRVQLNVLLAWERKGGEDDAVLLWTHILHTRLYKRLREQLHLIYNVEVEVIDHDDYTAVHISTPVRPEDYKTALKEVKAVVKATAAGVSLSEFQAAQNTAILKIRDRARTLTETMDALAGAQLDDTSYQTVAEEINDLHGVTLRQLHKVARRVVRTVKPTVIAIGPVDKIP